MSGAAASPSIAVALAPRATGAAALAGARAIPPDHRTQVPSGPVTQPWLDLRAPHAHEATNAANRASDIIRHHARRATRVHVHPRGHLMADMIIRWAQGVSGDAFGHAR